MAGLAALHLVILGLLLVHAAHFRLLFGVQTGISLSALTEISAGISVFEILKFVKVEDIIGLFLFVGLFWAVRLSSRTLKGWTAGIASVLVLVLFLISAVAPGEKERPAPAEIRLNPALFLISDVFEYARYDLASGDRNPPVGGRGRLCQGRFPANKQNGTDPSLSAADSGTWNVVLFVMESAGTRYLFETDRGSAVPMPFLRRISQEAWTLQRHYASSNLSTKALFSILSGRYDLFDRKPFGTHPDARIPSLNTFLAGRYDSFLVTPSSLAWYFPAAFVRNSGLRELHSYENLNLGTREEVHSLGHYIARDEVQTVDHFLQRLGRAREPFLGIYISFAAHFPYFDYGPGYRVLEEDGRLVTRYYNNLNLLDQMIRRIHHHLEKRGQLERTLLVIVGDHGQAFGQHHSDNYMHYRYSYNENLEAPVFFYQPSRFRPGVTHFPTSHVDLLPTLLDALKVPYDPSLFDGDSLLRRPAEKRTIFSSGYEGTLSSIDRDEVKVQYSLKKKRGWAFDLKRDPDERNRIEGTSFPDRIDALRSFAATHDAALIKYNASLAGMNGAGGQGHTSD
jgi:phosphoglycerol transferase MdoB-like AlkP superfamily enzyme